MIILIVLLSLLFVVHLTLNSIFQMYGLPELSYLQVVGVYLTIRAVRWAVSRGYDQ